MSTPTARQRGSNDRTQPWRIAAEADRLPEAARRLALLLEPTPGHFAVLPVDRDGRALAAGVAVEHGVPRRIGAKARPAAEGAFAVLDRWCARGGSAPISIDPDRGRRSAVGSAIALLLASIESGFPHHRWWCRCLRADDLVVLLAAAWTGTGQRERGGDADHAERALALVAEPALAALRRDRVVQALEEELDRARASERAYAQRLGRDEQDGGGSPRGERSSDEGGGPHAAPAIVGEHRGLRPVLRRVDQVAPADVPVLLLGETGSGKEVVARAIHERSERAAKPFVRVNCGAIAPDLIDSELFGHERGAFSGAIAQRRGWFERADGGTLFLDEVGELSLAAQVRLLRVLQDGLLERVGGETTIAVDVRIVAATHRDLPSLVHERRFREDLWYRLAVFPILLPPLRDRREDLPDLVEHFVRKAARRFGLPAPAIESADLPLLAAYDWPGNVRELQSVIDRAVLLGGGRTLDVATALGAAPRTVARAAKHASSSAEASRPSAVVPLDEAMRTHIGLALAATRGRIEGANGAARLLGINPHTLRARMRKLGVAWATYRS
jgi:transcriptional regulator with GAF, ATPase, and Fis domain